MTERTLHRPLAHRIGALALAIALLFQSSLLGRLAPTAEAALGTTERDAYVAVLADAVGGVGDYDDVTFVPADGATPAHYLFDSSSYTDTEILALIDTLLGARSALTGAIGNKPHFPGFDSDAAVNGLLDSALAAALAHDGIAPTDAVDLIIDEFLGALAAYPDVQYDIDVILGHDPYPSDPYRYIMRFDPYRLSLTQGADWARYTHIDLSMEYSEALASINFIKLNYPTRDVPDAWLNYFGKTDGDYVEATDRNSLLQAMRDRVLTGLGATAALGTAEDIAETVTKVVGSWIVPATSYDLLNANLMYVTLSNYGSYVNGYHPYCDMTPEQQAAFNKVFMAMTVRGFFNTLPNVANVWKGAALSTATINFTAPGPDATVEWDNPASLFTTSGRYPATFKEHPSTLYPLAYNVKVTVISRDALLQKITDAETLLGSVSVGTDPGEVPQAAKDALTAAISTANGVATGAAPATQQVVDDAVTALQNAMTAFAAAIIPPPVITTYPTASNVWKSAALSTSTLSGGTATEPGAFSWQNGTTTVAASGLYTAVFTPTDAGHSAVTFDVNVTAIDGTSLNTAIADAGILLDSADVGTDPGEVPQTAKDALSAAIATANSVAAGAAPATQLVVDDATTALQAAMTAFTAAIIPPPVITTYPTASNVWKGAALSTSALSGAVTTEPGTVVWQNGATVVTASGLYTAVFTPTDTGHSAVTFDVSVTAISPDALNTTITNAGTLLDSVAVGTDAGKVAQTAKDALSTAIATANSVATGAAPATQQIVDDATTALQNAMTAFTAAIIQPAITTYPTASNVWKGTPLSTSTLSGTVANTTGTTAWVNEVVTVNASGLFSAAFTPTNPAFSAIIFDVSVTVISRDALLQKITDAGTLLGSVDVGTDPGEVPQVAKDALTAAITVANGVATGAAPATQQIVDDAVTTLQSVMTAFTAAIIPPPVITTYPTASNVWKGAALSTSTLSGAVTTEPGTFAWQTPSTVVTASGLYTAVFTPTDAGHSAVTFDVNVTAIDGTSLNAAIADAGILLDSVDVGTDPGEVPLSAKNTLAAAISAASGVATGAAPATQLVVDDAVTALQNAMIAFTAAIIPPPVITTYPTASNVWKGAALSTSTLSGAVTTEPGTITWQNGATTVAASGLYTAVFTPTDSSHSPVSFDVSVTAISRDALNTAITNAGTLLDSVDVGTDPGEVPQTAKDALSDAITTANGVATGAVPATQLVVDDAVTALQNAMTAFAAAIIPPPVITTYPTASNVWKGAALSTSTLSGAVTTEPGTFAWQTPSTVVTASGSHPAVFTPTDVGHSAVTFDVSVTAISRDALNTAITGAGTLLSGVTVGTGVGQIAQADADLLSAAIATANSVAAGAAPATQLVVDDAVTALQNAMIAFTAAIIPPPVITTYPTASNVWKGAALSTSTLSGAVTTEPGTITWQNGATTVTASGLYTALFTPTDSSHSPVTFDVSVTAISRDALNTAIADAGILLGSADVGTDVGEVPQAAKDALSDAITAASGVATGAAPATQQVVDDATTALQAAMTAFAAAIIQPAVTTYPTASNVWKGAALSTSLLSGTVANTAGTTAWVSGAATVNASGLFSAAFTPADTTFSPIIFDVSVTAIDGAALNAAIGSATALLGSVAVGTDPGEVSQAAKDALSDAITAANGVATGAAPATQKVVDDAVTALEAAIATFMAAIVPSPITAYPTATNAWKGAALSTSLLSGEVVGEPGTVAWVDGTVILTASGLYPAMFTPTNPAHPPIYFDVSVTVIDGAALQSLVNGVHSMWLYTGIGAGAGQVPQGSSDALKAVIAMVNNMLAGNAPLSQHVVSDALRALQIATDSFNASVIPAAAATNTAAGGSPRTGDTAGDLYSWMLLLGAGATAMTLLRKTRRT